MRASWLLLVLYSAVFATASRGASETITGLRVMVRLAVDPSTGAPPDERVPAIEQRASASAGVPVRHLAASGGHWHALILQCAAEQCDAALRRLQSDNTRFSAVQRDELRRP